MKNNIVLFLCVVILMKYIPANSQCSGTCMLDNFGTTATCDGQSAGATEGVANAYMQNHCYHQYSKTTGTAPGDGEYWVLCDGGYKGSITNTSWQGAYNNPTWTIQMDHTTGNGTGYYALVNSGAGPREFYHRTISNLCPNTTYAIKYYAGNPVFHTSGPNCVYNNLPSLKAYTFPSGTAVQAIANGGCGASNGTSGFSTTGSTSNGAATGSMSCQDGIGTAPGGMTWTAYTYNYTTGAAEYGFDLVLVTLLGNNSGYDFAIDDISVSFVSGSTSCSTPVTLSNFMAIKNGKEVYIKWQTATEINNDYFIVEKSKNGIDFIPIERIKGAGTSQQPLSYQTTDLSPYEGTSYYRLKQVDYDGKASYSKITAVENDEAKVEIYPNPSEGSFKISIINEKQPYSIEIADVEGKVVYTSQGNSDNAIAEINGLSKGIYVVRIIGSCTTVRKLVVM